MNEDVFVVKVNRLLLLFLGLLGSLFVYVGILGVWFDAFKGWDVYSENAWLIPVFYWFFCFGLGGTVALQMFWSFIFPPTLMRIDREGIAFADSMRYHLRLFPWKHYKSAHLGVDLAVMAVAKQFLGGAQIEFEPSSEIPSMLVTGMGIGYFNNTLTFDWRYADRFATTIVAETKRLAAKYSGKEEQESKNDAASGENADDIKRRYREGFEAMARESTEKMSRSFMQSALNFISRFWK